MRLADRIELWRLEGEWDKDSEMGMQHFRFPVEFHTITPHHITGEYGRNSTTNRGKITGGSFDENTMVLTFNYVQTFDGKKGTARLVLYQTENEHKLHGTWTHDGGESGGLKMRSLYKRN